MTCLRQCSGVSPDISPRWVPADEGGWNRIALGLSVRVLQRSGRTAFS
jgi:hypothetical protein